MRTEKCFGHMTIANVIAWLFLLIPLAINPAWALDSDEAVRLDIPPQKLSSALVAFSKQAKLQIVTSSEQLKDQESEGAVGTFKLSTALQKLLNGSGLSYKRVGQ